MQMSDFSSQGNAYGCSTCVLDFVKEFVASSSFLFSQQTSLSRKTDTSWHNFLTPHSFIFERNNISDPLGYR